MKHISECECCDAPVMFGFPQINGWPMRRMDIKVLCPDCFNESRCFDAQGKIHVKATFASGDDYFGLVDGYEEFNE